MITEQLPLFDMTDAPEKRPALVKFTPFQRALDGSAKAANKWTPAQQAMVDDAILRAATELPEITTDDVWNRLPEDFPITKGIAGHMHGARTRGILLNTTRCTICKRSRNNNAQRLTVWASLIHKG